VKKKLQKVRAFSLALAVMLLFAVSCATTSGMSEENIKVALSGNQEVPPVKTAATGTGAFMIKSDKSVSGSITITGMNAIAAHIHEAEAGKNGPVIVPLSKTSDTTWSTAPGAKLTDAQYASFLAGKLYVNAHTAANKGGEIRAQLVPAK